MKKKLFISLGLAMVVAVSAVVGTYAATKMILIVNGKTAAVDPIVIKGVTYVPLRAAASMLGADVRYDASTNTVTVTGKDAPPTNSALTKKSFNVDITVNSGPMILKISKVTLDPAYKDSEFNTPIKAVIFDASAENTSTDTVHWYPSHGKIVTNTNKTAYYTYDRNMINGDFIGKVVKTGKIVFEIKGEVDVLAISSMNYFVDAPLKEIVGDVGGKDEVVELILK